MMIIFFNIRIHCFRWRALSNWFQVALDPVSLKLASFSQYFCINFLFYFYFSWLSFQKSTYTSSYCMNCSWNIDKLISLFISYQELLVGHQHGSTDRQVTIQFRNPIRAVPSTLQPLTIPIILLIHFLKFLFSLHFRFDLQTGKFF